MVAVNEQKQEKALIEYTLGDLYNLQVALKGGAPQKDVFFDDLQSGLGPGNMYMTSGQHSPGVNAFMLLPEYLRGHSVNYDDSTMGGPPTFAQSMFMTDLVGYLSGVVILPYALVEGMWAGANKPEDFSGLDKELKGIEENAEQRFHAYMENGYRWEPVARARDVENGDEYKWDWVKQEGAPGQPAPQPGQPAPAPGPMPNYQLPQQALALMNGNYMAVNELTTKLNEFETAIEKNNPKLLYGLLNDMQQTMLGVVSALNESALLDTNIDMSKIESGITTTGLTLDTYNTNLGNVPGTGEATG
jgi:hypothetical protein